MFYWHGVEQVNLANKAAKSKPVKQEVSCKVKL